MTPSTSYGICPMRREIDDRTMPAHERIAIGIHCGLAGSLNGSASDCDRGDHEPLSLLRRLWLEPRGCAIAFMSCGKQQGGVLQEQRLQRHLQGVHYLPDGHRDLRQP